MTTTISLWRAGKSFLAGIVCGLLFYKPQLGAVVASVLCLCQGRRALLGLALTCTALVLVNVLTLPGTLKEFVFVMPQNLHWMQEEIVYRWARHITFKAFWRKAIQDDAVGPLSATVKILWGLCEAALLAGLLALIVKTRRGLDPACRRDRLISTTLIAMPLLMPFYFDYDLLLLSIGIAVYVADRERDGIPEHSANWEDRWLVRVFILFYVGLEFTLRSRIHPIVPLLSFATVLLIRRGLRPQAMPATASQPVLFPTALAA
jgi:hypothetical protein